jgi:HK97 family phage portal protein
MALWDQIKTMLAIQPTFESVQTLHARNIPDMDLGSSTVSDLLLRAQGLLPRPWRAKSVEEALSNPAIFRAVTLISNTTASLGVEAYKNGSLLPDDQTPRVVKRPDPFRTPGEFYGDSAYYLATRGECWWWIAKRDIDGQALSLILMPPWEVVTTVNNRDRLRPTVKWLDAEMPLEDIRLIRFLPDDRSPSGPFQRGVGPLQKCGAAISVAVEATEWAANHFAGGGRPPLIIKSASELGANPDYLDAASEAAGLRDQWMDQDANTPRVIDPGIEDVIFPPETGQSAQMLDARTNENGNAARMFGIPGSLLEYAQSGSSLHYQNDLTEFIKFIKVCLAPDYLEKIESKMSDLLTRSTVSRFSVKGFLRADPKTRAEVYNLLVPLGIITVEEAREDEGYAPGDVEFAPVPFAPPAAVPDRLPIQRVAARSSDGLRCSNCRRLLAELASPPYRFTCPKCKTVNAAEVEARTVDQPQIVISPTIHTPPPAPMIVNVNSPEAETKIDEVRERMTAMDGNVIDLSEHVDRLSNDLGSRITGLGDAHEALVNRLNQPPKARTFVPVRDANGVIVSVKEEAS